VLAFFAPAVVALTSLRDMPLAMVFEGIDGTIRSSGASLGWFSAVEYRNVEIHDRQGSLLARVPAVTVERTVLNLLFDRARLGKVTLEQPELNVVARADGSNAEDVLLPWWNMPSGGPIEMVLQVVDGAVNLHDSQANKTWTIASLAASLQLTLDAAAPTAWSAEGKIEDGARSRMFRATSAADADAIELKSEQIPLAMFGWFARRFYGDLNLTGDLACDVVWRPGVTPSDDGESASGDATQTLRGQVAVRRLSVFGGPLHTDTLALDDLLVAADMQASPQRIQLKELTADCELARITASGTFAVPHDRQTLAALAHEQFSLKGSLDLARLAQMLPRTLRVRPDRWCWSPPP
jgi:hypothetical protein